MAYHKYGEGNTKEIILYEYLPKLKTEISVAHLIFDISDDELIISQIRRESIAKRHFDSSYHFGTDIFNRLLWDLKFKSKIQFSKIYGTLSSSDAKADDAGESNWDTSIPFYCDFPKRLNEELGYRLEFHLFNKQNKIEEVYFPENSNDRKLFMKEFKQQHMSLNMNASFAYYVIKNSTSKEF